MYNLVAMECFFFTLYIKMQEVPCSSVEYNSHITDKYNIQSVKVEYGTIAAVNSSTLVWLDLEFHYIGIEIINSSK